MKEKKPDTKIIAITGYDTPENKKAIMAQGTDAYIPKPFGLKELALNVEKLLENKAHAVK